MTPTQYRETLATLGLSQLRAARLLGVEGRTVRHWCKGDRDIPEMAIRFLRLASHIGIEKAEALLAGGECGGETLKAVAKPSNSVNT